MVSKNAIESNEITPDIQLSASVFVYCGMKFLFLLLLCPTALLHAQTAASDTTTSVEFLPGTVIAPTLLANPSEPRTGVRTEFGSSRLKLDLGAPFELLHLRLGENGDRLAAGALIFAYGLTTSSDGLRLQVSTVDGFFGGYVALLLERADVQWSVRLRLLHQSAHLVDGAYDTDAGDWSDGRVPLPFTRDFGELTGHVVLRRERFRLRLYAGGSYATHLRPEELGRYGVMGGVEGMVLAGRLAGQPLVPYVAQHVSFGGKPELRGTWSLEAGVRFGAPESSGLRLYCGVITGPEIYGQYTAETRTSWGAGFAFDIR